MGNDGGSIPTRRELVKEGAKNPTTTQLKEKLHELLDYHWSTCPLSHKPLATPIVSDSIGKLYNKDAILQYLLPSDDESGAEALRRADAETVLEGRVKSLKDVVEVRFEVEESGGSKRWVCPVTNKELGPKVRAVYLVPCGHAFSESAIKEMAGDRCLTCNEAYKPENIIPILPTNDAETDRLKERARKLAETGLSHSLKKASGASKKRKKHAETAVSKDPITAAQAEDKSKSSTPQPPNGASTGGIKNAATAALTARVLEEEKERKKRRKMADNQNLKSLFSSGHDNKGKSSDFMTRGFSIPSNAKR